MIAILYGFLFTLVPVAFMMGYISGKYDSTRTAYHEGVMAGVKRERMWRRMLDGARRPGPLPATDPRFQPPI